MDKKEKNPLKKYIADRKNSGNCIRIIAKYWLEIYKWNQLIMFLWNCILTTRVYIIEHDIYLCYTLGNIIEKLFSV